MRSLEEAALWNTSVCSACGCGRKCAVVAVVCTCVCMPAFTVMYLKGRGLDGSHFSLGEEGCRRLQVLRACVLLHSGASSYHSSAFLLGRDHHGLNLLLSRKWERNTGPPLWVRRHSLTFLFTGGSISLSSLALGRNWPEPAPPY